MLEILVDEDGQKCPEAPHWHWNGSPWRMHQAGLMNATSVTFHAPEHGIMEQFSVSIRHQPLEAEVTR